MFLQVIIFTITAKLLDSQPHRLATRIVFDNKDLCSLRKPIVHSLDGRRSSQSNNKSVVIWVSSARHHFKRRNLIRETWGSIKSYNNVTILAVVFMLGNAHKIGDKLTNVTQLEAERILFTDIIIGDFIDSYRNLSRKAIMALEWLTSTCQNAQIIVKTDDDVVLNIFKLTEELNAWSPTELKASNIWCVVQRNEKTVKDKASIFYVEPGTFKNDIFPSHCGGVGWVAPMRVIVRIINEIRRSFPGRILTHEDVFVTGMVPAKINQRLFSEPIQFVDRNFWVDVHLYEESGVYFKYLLNIFEQWPNITVDYGEFRGRLGSKVFYLLCDSSVFYERFERLWKIIQKSFQK